MPRAVLCLPTYNERENLEAMVSALGDVLRDGDRVLVIDDGSPDGTGELADRLAAEHEVGALLCGRDQTRHVLRVVREVAVHLEHELGTVRERSSEPCDVRRPEPLLGLAMQNRDPGELRGEAIGSGDSRIRPAARRYAMTLNDSSSRSSEMSASRSSWFASSSLRGNV